MGKVELKLEVDAELLARARAAGTEPQTVLEEALRALPDPTRRWSFVDSAQEKVKDPKGTARRAREWAEEDREAIEDHNTAILRRGLFSDTVPRRW